MRFERALHPAPVRGHLCDRLDDLAHMKTPFPRTLQWAYA